MNKPMIRWLGVGALCAMLSVAQATIQEDLNAGLTLGQAIQKALDEGIPAKEIALQLIAAGVDPVRAIEWVVNVVPTTTAAKVAEFVIERMPEYANEINNAVLLTISGGSTPNMIVAKLNKKTPVIEGEVDGFFQPSGLIDTGETTPDGKTIFRVSNPGNGDPTGLRIIINEADDDTLIVVNANNNPTNGRININNNLPDPASPH